MTVACIIQRISLSLYLSSLFSQKTFWGTSVRLLLRQERLLADPIFADVALVSQEGQELWAHRALLAAASPVFHRMFESGMVETQESRVKISAPKEVLNSFVSHIYSGSFDPNMDAQAMIELAHMYDLQDLAAFCGELLVDNLAPANVSQCARKIGRLRGDGQDVFEQIWERMTNRIESDPVLVRALLEGHVHDAS